MIFFVNFYGSYLTEVNLCLNKKTCGYFGTGECFVLKLKQTRGKKCHSSLDQVQMESEVEAFAFSNS